MQSFNAVGCVWQVLKPERVKQNDDVIMTKLNTGYLPSKFQISWLSGSNFMEVSVRHQNTIMTSFLVTEFPA